MIYKLTNDLEEIIISEKLLYEVLFKPIDLSNSARQQFKIPGDEYFFVAFDGTEAAGVMLVVVNGDYVELRHGAVSCKYHGKGIGSGLWNEVQRFLQDKGIRTIELYSRNTALGFWTKLGFEEISGWIDHQLFARHEIRFKKMRYTAGERR
ncbi:GNAT family N-acetyltransferase [Paenibacillus tarimensis]